MVSQLLGCNFVIPPDVNSWIIPSHQRIEAVLSYLVFGKNNHGKAAMTSVGHLNSLCCTSCIYLVGIGCFTSIQKNGPPQL